MNMPLHTHLAFEGILLELPLGGDGKVQPIEIDVKFLLPRMPLGCVSDEVKDAISCSKCVEIIRTTATKKPYQLLEHLAYQIHTALKKELPIHFEIMVKVKQLQSQFPEIKHGVSFTFFPPKEQEEKKKAPSWADD